MSRHLIHIGFPKAGSTALQTWFARHPRLIYVPDGIGGSRNVEELASRAAIGGDRGRWSVTSSERLIMPRRIELHRGLDEPKDEPVTERRRQACELLRELFGDATILIVTRGFRGILASVYSQYVRVGGTMGPSELFQRPEPAEDYYDYGAAVALYSSVFGAERVIVLPYELLRADPHAFVAELESRLGITPTGSIPPWVNAALTGAELYWYPRFSRLAGWVTAPLGARGARALDFYCRRIDGPDLRRSVGVLARMAPGARVDPATYLPAELVERCRGRAVELGRLPVYAPYAAEYLNDAP